VSGASLLRLFAEQAATSLGAEAERDVVLRAAVAGAPGDPAGAVDGIVRYFARREFGI
jgi:hypothetical protein